MVYDNLVNILVVPLHSVAVASLSKMRDDTTALRDAWAKALATVSFYAMPAFGLLAATSQDVIVLLLGSKWSSAGVLLGVLAFRGIPHSVERTVGWLHVTAGRTDRLIRYGVFAACIQLAALACGLPFGPIGIAVAYVVSMFLLFVPALAYAGRPLGIGAADVLRVVWRPLVGSLAAGFVNLSGVGGLRAMDLQKLLAGKIASARPYASLSSHGVSGSAQGPTGMLSHSRTRRRTPASNA